MIGGRPILGGALATLCGWHPFGVRTWKLISFELPVNFPGENFSVHLVLRCPLALLSLGELYHVVVHTGSGGLTLILGSSGMVSIGMLGLVVR